MELARLQENMRQLQGQAADLETQLAAFQARRKELLMNLSEQRGLSVPSLAS